nr:reverse transcriptase domain-containing protein [Tanacetum cinerariifolium]
MKTREDYGSGIARPMFDDKAHFELNGQFLKELRDNTFSESDNEDANEHIEKVLEIVDLFYIPDLGSASKLLLRCPQHYLTDILEVISFYEGLDVPTTQILDSKGAIISMKAADAKKAIQDMPDHSKKWHNEIYTRTRSTDTAIQAQLNNLRREIKKTLKSLLMDKPRMGYQIKASMNVHDSAILEDSLPPKKKDPGSFTIPCYISNICFEKDLADLGASVSVMHYSTFTNVGLGKLTPTKLIIELADRTIKLPKGIAENVLVGIDKFVFPVDFVVLHMPEDIKAPLILKRLFLSTAHAKIDVFKRKIVRYMKSIGHSIKISLSPQEANWAIGRPKVMMIPMLAHLGRPKCSIFRALLSLQSLLFRLPRVIMTDNETQLVNDLFKSWFEKWKIKQINTVAAHPQANSLVERANKSLMHDLKTYGFEAVILAEIGMPTYRTIQFNKAQNKEEMRLNLDIIQEIKKTAAIQEAKYKKKVEQYYNKRVRLVSFKIGDFVYCRIEASRVKNQGKLGPNWEGPYRVIKAYDNGFYKLSTMNDREVPRTWHVINL